jgi:hypothetical protein
MAKKELVDYIKKELKAGYDISYLRNYLIKQGYSAKDVNDAIDSIYEKKKIELPLILISVIVVVIIIGGIIAISRLLAPAEREPEYEIPEPVTTQPAVTIPSGPPSQEQPEQQVEVRYVPRAMTITQLLNQMPYMSESQVAGECRRFTATDKDNCFNRLALEKGKSSYCSEIINIRKKDNCYMAFAYLDDFSVCVEIQDIYLKQSCRELGRAEFNITG